MNMTPQARRDTVDRSPHDFLLCRVRVGIIGNGKHHSDPDRVGGEGAGVPSGCEPVEPYYRVLSIQELGMNLERRPAQPHREFKRPSVTTFIDDTINIDITNIPSAF